MNTQTYAFDRTTRLLNKLAAEVKRALETPDADAVHDLRVAIRRFKQALTVFADWFPAKESKKIRRRLREPMDAAGRVRDRDIAAELVARCKAPDAAALAAAISTERDQAARELVAEVGRLSLEDIGVRWRDLLGLKAPSPETDTPAPGNDHAAQSDPGAMARSLLLKTVRKFFSSGRRAVDRRHSARALHRFRIEGKRFRYSMELFEPLYGPKVAEKLKAVRHIQGLLGDLNDCVAVGDILTAHAASPELIAATQRRQRSKTREFVHYWGQLDSSEAENRWARYLGRYARTPANGVGTSSTHGKMG